MKANDTSTPVADGGPGSVDLAVGDGGLPAWVRDILRCPVTGASLTDGTGPDGSPELHSTDSTRPLAYPVRDGIPVLLEVDSRPL